MAFMKFYVGNEVNASSHRDGIYIAIDTKKIFYNGDAYGGSEVDLSNYYTIDQVDGKIGTNVYTGANYISKETNLTDAVLQLDVEIKATNDNLALEHANAEATYAKKTELGNYLPLSGGELNGNLSVIGDNNLSVDGSIWIRGVDSKYSNLFKIEKGNDLYMIRTYSNRLVGEFSYDTEHCRMNYNSITFQKFTSITSAKESIINFDGFTISGKTSQDLLHAAGGTISIEELKSQLSIPDTSNLATKNELKNYLPLAGGKIAYNTSDYIQIIPRGTAPATPYIYISGQGTTNEDDKFYIGIGRRFPGQLSSAGAKILAETNYSQMIIDPNEGSITAFRKGTVEGVKETQYRYNGVYMGGKTSNDLLHANGGTISISDILSQIPKATTSTLGGIKVGDGLEITDDGTLNCTIDPGSGSVSWGNITGKPSVFATNIDSINDLNSGWDALLKAAPNIPSLDGYATQEWVNGKGFLTSVPSEYVTDTELNAKGFLTKAIADSTYQAKGNYLTSVSWSQISDKPTFATVATSGSYDDLTNKPTIPNVSTANYSGTISLVIDRNTLTFKSDGIAFNGALIMEVPVVEVLSTEEINQILNS